MLSDLPCLSFHLNLALLDCAIYRLRSPVFTVEI